MKGYFADVTAAKNDKHKTEQAAGPTRQWLT
jgi:hypothetical protein